MAHFYGTLSGRAKTVGTRCGTKTSGIATVAASWQGAVSTTLYEHEGTDYALVQLIPWHGSGQTKVLYRGPVGGSNNES